MKLISKPQKPVVALNFTNGQFQQAGGEQFDVDSPYLGMTIGHSHNSTNDDIHSTVSHAKEAFSIWSQTPLKERCQVMFRAREYLNKHIDEISECVSLENGKILTEARAEVLKGIEVLEYALSLQNLDLGGRMQVSRGVYCEYRRRPLGVIANITPFNFPAMVPMWTIPIALTLGNSYIWKPSEKTPLTSTWLARCFQEAGLPPGVFSVLNGGKETAETIIQHPDVKAIGFVGSTPIAKKVYQLGTQLGKRVLALGGAKNHIILLPDADPEIAGRGISDSFTGCAGQRCMAASVLLAVGNVDTQIEHIKKRAQSQQLGSDMGAIISAQQVEFLNQHIEKALQSGAQLLLDGRTTQPQDEYKSGYWLGPTILDHVSPDSEAAKTELFGPILSIIRCQNLSEAIEIENQNEYGNACSVFTRTGVLAEKVLASASAGMLGVNIGVPVPREPFSFGGINESKFGHGDITGSTSLNFWSDLQKITQKWEAQNDENWMS